MDKERLSDECKAARFKKNDFFFFYLICGNRFKPVYRTEKFYLAGIDSVYFRRSR